MVGVGERSGGGAGSGRSDEEEGVGINKLEKWGWTGAALRGARKSGGVGRECR